MAKNPQNTTFKYHFVDFLPTYDANELDLFSRRFLCKMYVGTFEQRSETSKKNFFFFFEGVTFCSLLLTF